MKYSAFLIAFFTTIVRYYDYALFGLSASVLAKVFMPSAVHQEQLLNFFVVFSLAVCARPFGSIIFGMIGDSLGRAVSVKISAFIAAISTTIIAFLPSFSAIGYMAAYALLFCRMLFLMSLAGEADAIKIYVAEKAQSSKKNLANGTVSSCSQIGALLAAFSYHYAMQLDSGEQIWRINFIIGGLFGGVVIALRHYFQESEEFLAAKARSKTALSPKESLPKIIFGRWQQFLLAMLISGSCGGVYHFLVIFWSTFSGSVAHLLEGRQAPVLNIYLIATYAVTSIIAGFLADRINPYKQIFTALISSLSLVIIMQLYLLKSPGLKYIPLVLIGLVPFYVIPLQIILQSIFTVDVRMRLYSLSHSLGAVIFSSTTPLLCMLLWKYSGSVKLVLGFLGALLAILLVSVSYMCARKFSLNK